MKKGLFFLKTQEPEKNVIHQSEWEMLSPFHTCFESPNTLPWRTVYHKQNPRKSSSSLKPKIQLKRLSVSVAGFQMREKKMGRVYDGVWVQATNRLLEQLITAGHQKSSARLISTSYWIKWDEETV